MTIPYKPGDYVAYSTFSGEKRVCLVTERYPDVKNGIPGFDGIITGPDGDVGVWGYDSQIRKVLAPLEARTVQTISATQELKAVIS